MSTSLDDRRAQDLARVESRASAALAYQFASAIDATIAHLRTMRHGITQEFGVNVDPGASRSKEATDISNHMLDNAFSDDAVNDLPLDFQAAVDESSGDLLNGDDEIAVDHVRRWIRTAIKNLAATN